MIVRLTYFKSGSGKLYTRGEYSSDYKFGFQVYSEVSMMSLSGKLPGLAETNRRTKFIVLIESDEIPSQLILPS